MRDLVTTDISIPGAPLVVTGLHKTVGAGARGELPLAVLQRRDLERSRTEADHVLRRTPATHYFPVSIPYHGCALNITVQSYTDQLDFGLVACSETVPDAQRVADFLVEDFATMRRASAQLSEPGAVKAIAVEPRSAAPLVRGPIEVAEAMAAPRTPKIEKGGVLMRSIDALGTTTESLMRQLGGARPPAAAAEAQGRRPKAKRGKSVSARRAERKTSHRQSARLS